MRNENRKTQRYQIDDKREAEVDEVVNTAFGKYMFLKGYEFKEQTPYAHRDNAIREAIGQWIGWKLRNIKKE